jgi:hypothetical protein
MKAVVAAREPLHKEIETSVGLRERPFSGSLGLYPFSPFRVFPAGQYHV